MKTAIIGTYPPRQCGIATFTQDLFRAIRPWCGEAPGIIAVSDGSEPGFPQEVRCVIHRDDAESYRQAAAYINACFDLVIIQHEYGIFGGDTGQHILLLAHELHIPIVTNFHTVLKTPNPREKTILQILAGLSRNVTVMTRSGVDLLSRTYRVIRENIVLIPHGVPHFPYSQEEAKQLLGLEDKKIMLSFGFLGPGKGLETAIEALPSVRDNDFLYIILGSTHPNVLRQEGEAYRNLLIESAHRLGVSERVQFVNQFATVELLTQYLCACDIYVTPYPNENQISSGTLSFAVGAGAAVLSTPYRYAKDLLGHQRGQLFDFGDSRGLAVKINQLLTRPRLLAKYRRNAASYGKRMAWSEIGKLHYALLNQLYTPLNRARSIEFPTADLGRNIPALLSSSREKLSF